MNPLNRVDASIPHFKFKFEILKLLFCFFFSFALLLWVPGFNFLMRFVDQNIAYFSLVPLLASLVAGLGYGVMVSLQYREQAMWVGQQTCRKTFKMVLIGFTVGYFTLVIVGCVPLLFLLGSVADSAKSIYEFWEWVLFLVLGPWGVLFGGYLIIFLVVQLVVWIKSIFY